MTNSSMVFARKVKNKGKEYWILVHSIRKGKKIIQKTRYIGKALPPTARLEHLKKEFFSELSKNRFKFLSEEDIKSIEKKKTEYIYETKLLSPLEKDKRLKEFIIRYTYDSSKLSGADITLRQTYLILKEGIIPENFKNIKTAKELENHEKGIIAITTYKGVLNIRFLQKLHKILFLGVDDSIAGKLRNELKKDVKIAGTSYIPPKWNELKKALENFFRWYKSENRKLHPLELASLLHLKMISLQPFADGNSRLSRLLMNWILWKKKYPPVNIPIEDLENYYDVLDRYQVEKKEKPFIDYIKGKYLGGK